MRTLEKGKLIVASHNAGKLKEFDGLIGPFGFDVSSVAALGLPEPDETGTTFEENAYIKALAAAEATGLPALSDDSGLMVDALDGEPGVYTANWAEAEDGTRDFDMAMRKVEDLLQERVRRLRTSARRVSSPSSALHGRTAKRNISVAKWKAC